MSEPRKQFTFYKSYYDAISLLPEKDQAAVVMAVAAYALYEIEPDLEGVQASVFTLIRPTLDVGRRKAEAGRASGVSRSQNSSDRTKHEQSMNRTRTEAEQNANTLQANHEQTANEKEKEKEKELEIELELDKNILKEKGIKMNGYMAEKMYQYIIEQCIFL